MPTIKHLNKIIGTAVCTIGIGALSAIIATSYFIGKNAGNSIPDVSHVQEGFIAPNDLEIGVMSSGSNKVPITVMRAYGDTYGIKFEDGRPVLSKIDTTSERYEVLE